MKKFLPILFLSVLSLIPFQVEACSCFYDPEQGFCEFFGYADIVVIVEKTKEDDRGMNARIIEVLSGNPGDNEIRLWTATATCMASTHTLDIGKTYVMALGRVGQGWNDIKAGDYYLPACGVYHLDYNNGKVEGKILRGQTNKMNLEEFKEVLNKPECPGSLSYVNSYFSQADQILNLSSSTDLTEDLKVEVLDMNGKKAAYHEFQGGDAAANRWTWDLKALKPGVYVVRIALPSGYQKVQKILIQRTY